MPKQIQTVWPGQALVKLFGLKGRYQPVLDETIVPVTVVGQETLSSPAQARAQNIAGGAGKNSFIRLTNPADSGLRMVIEGFNAQTASTQEFLISLAPFSLAGATTVTVEADWRTTGLPGAPAAIVVAGIQTTATMPGTAEYTFRDTILRVNIGEYRAVIEPGGVFVLHGATASVTWTRAGLLWTETPLNVATL